MKGKKAIQSKFPTARIKKIMQEDEEIGKVAAGAPIVISRALELFLKDFILESSVIAKEGGAKKIQPWHLKRAAQTNPDFDFLDDLLSKTADPSGSGGASGNAGGNGAGVGGSGSAPDSGSGNAVASGSGSGKGKKEGG